MTILLRDQYCIAYLPTHDALIMDSSRLGCYAV